MKEKISTRQLPQNKSTYYFIYTGIFRNFRIDGACKILRSCREYEKVENGKENGFEKGIEPFLNVYERLLRVDYPAIPAHFKWQASSKRALTQQAKISRSFRLCQSGKLSYCVKLECKESLKFEDVVAIARADRSQLRLSFRKQRKDKDRGLFDLFRDDTKMLLLNLSKGEMYCEWLDTALICDKGKLRRNPKSDPFVVGDCFQQPYVVTCIDLIGHQEENIETVVKYLSNGFGSVLRAKYSCFHSGKFLEQYIESGKSNISVDTRVFLTLYPRSCLFVYGDRKEHPGEETIIGVVDTIELLRMTWHGLILSSLILDRKIHDLRLQYRAYKAKKSKETKGISGTLKTGTNAETLTQILAGIVELRIDIAEVLEDPIGYRRATGHLSELYDLALEEFRIDELQDTVLKRLEQVDRLYDNMTELWRRRESEALDKEWVEIRKIQKRLKLR